MPVPWRRPSLETCRPTTIREPSAGDVELADAVASPSAVSQRPSPWRHSSAAGNLRSGGWRRRGSHLSSGCGRRSRRHRCRHCHRGRTGRSSRRRSEGRRRRGPSRRSRRVWGGARGVTPEAVIPCTSSPSGSRTDCRCCRLRSRVSSRRPAEGEGFEPRIGVGGFEEKGAAEKGSLAGTPTYSVLQPSLPRVATYGSRPRLVGWLVPGMPPTWTP